MERNIKVRQVLIVFLCIMLIFAVGFLNNNFVGVYAYNGFKESVDELEQDFKNDSVIVVLDENVSAVNKEHSKEFFGDIEIESIVDLTKKDVNNKIRTNKFRQILQIFLKNGTREKVLKAVQIIKQLDGIVAVEPNYIFTSSKDPNDTYYVSGKMWGLNGTNGINMSSAWDITKGSKNVRVGVIDSGIAIHPDLNSNVVEGWDFFHDNVITKDDTASHGTHVAGTIGAVGNNNLGVVGVNHNVTLVPLQASNDENKFEAAIVTKAIEWATNKWGTSEQIDILNYSVGGFGRTFSLIEAISNFPGLFVWSAGNSKENIDDIKYASSFNLPNLISVGALDKNGDRRHSSSYGQNLIDIYAPGGDILSTHPYCTTDNCDMSSHVANGYHYMSGTSMAAPHVSGVAALILSKKPNLTGCELKTLILEGADYITITLPPGEVTQQRVKKLNAYKAVKLVDDSDSKHLVFLETTNNSEWAYASTQVLWLEKGSPWPATVNIPEAPFGYEFKGYYYGIDYAADTQHAVYLENGNFNSRNYYFKQDNFNASGDITLQGRWMPKDYYFILGNRHAADWDHPLNGMVGSRNYEESISKLAADKDTVNGVTKAFTHWEMSIGNDEPIIYTTDLQLEFTVKEIVDRYCRNYDALGKPSICFYAIYNTNVSSGGGGSCLAPGSLITLADGTQKAVELLDGSESLLVWDMYTGSFASAPILFIDGDTLDLHDVINLYFSDGTTVEVIYEHAFWDCNLNEYAFLRNDADKYIGHWFNKQTVGADGGMSWTSVQLTDVVLTQEYTTTWSPVTYGHLCYYVNGMLSMPGATEGLINIFDVDGDTLKYNEASIAADIEKYGLFTYEEFAEMYTVSENIFNAFNGQYLKVSLGKGLITAEQIEYLINRYSQYFD